MSKKWTEKDIIGWISQVTQNNKIKNFSHLKDGSTICEFMNVISPGSIQNIQKGSMSSSQNISSFVDAVKKYVSGDLVFKASDFPSFSKRKKVLATFTALNDVLVKDDSYEGPYITKVAQKKGFTGTFETSFRQKEIEHERNVEKKKKENIEQMKTNRSEGGTVKQRLYVTKKETEEETERQKAEYDRKHCTTSQGTIERQQLQTNKKLLED